MISLAFVIMFLRPELLQHQQEPEATRPPDPAPATLTTALQQAKRRSLGMLTGRDVKRILGAPSNISTVTFCSAGTWHYSFLRYDNLGLCVTLYAENRLIWAIPGMNPFPEDWQVQNIQFFDPRPDKSK